MFKCIDKVVGEIIEAPTKQILLEKINDRFVSYNNTMLSNYKTMKVSCYCINDVYYIVKM